MELLNGQLGNGELDSYKDLVDECLAEYDLDGWRVPDLASFAQLGDAGRALLGG